MENTAEFGFNEFVNERCNVMKLHATLYQPKRVYFSVRTQ